MFAIPSLPMLVRPMELLLLSRPWNAPFKLTPSSLSFCFRVACAWSFGAVPHEFARFIKMTLSVSTQVANLRLGGGRLWS